MIERLVALAVGVVALAVLTGLGVQAYGRARERLGKRDAEIARNRAEDEALDRFDKATGIPTETDLDSLMALQRTRLRARLKLLRRKLGL